jgi:hypothetical protein
MIGWIIGLAIVGLAAAILIRRTRDFVRTRGMSGCQNCPFSGQGCSGQCKKKQK